MKMIRKQNLKKSVLKSNLCCFMITTLIASEIPGSFFSEIQFVWQMDRRMDTPFIKMRESILKKHIILVMDCADLAMRQGVLETKQELLPWIRRPQKKCGYEEMKRKYLECSRFVWVCHNATHAFFMFSFWLWSSVKLEKHLKITLRLPLLAQEASCPRRGIKWSRLTQMCHIAQWARITKNPEVSTGSLARPFACSLALLTHLLAPPCLLCLHAPLCSLVRLLAHFAHSLACGTVKE